MELEFIFFAERVQFKTPIEPTRSHMNYQLYILTRRERLKSAPYLRLKKLKLFEIAKGGPFGFFENPICCGV